MKKLLSPLYIGDAGREEFLATVSRIAHLAREYGAEQAPLEGNPLEQIDRDENARQRFITACHEGFDRAQTAAGQLVLELGTTIKQAEHELAEARRNRNKDAAKDQALTIEAMSNRQLVLRRVIDSIYFVLLNQEADRYRRFLVHRTIQHIDPAALGTALSLAATRNREQPLRFSLVADLTTGMHMADLVEIDRTKPEPKLAIIELKAGETNRALLDILAQQPDANNVEQINAMGPKAWKQIERIVRQHGRLQDAFEVMTTDRGFDTLNQSPIAVLKEPVPVEGYLEILLAVCIGAARTGVSCQRIDECLSLVAISEDSGLTITDGLVKHYFYHLDPETPECVLSRGGAISSEEVRRVAQSSLQFVDLGKFHLRDISGPGLFAMVPTPIALDIVAGKLRLFAQFDVARFFLLAERHGIKIKWGTRKESAEAIRRKLSARIPGAPSSAAVVHYWINQRKGRGCLLHGFFLRPFRELQRSLDLIGIIRAHGAQSSGGATQVHHFQ